MSRERAVAAIRQGVAFSVLDDVHVARLRGEGARGAAELLCPCDLAMRTCQARATVLLDEDGCVIADAYLARDEDSWLLYTEGLGLDAFREHLDRVLGDRGEEVVIDDLTKTHRLVSLNGPFAWQLMGVLEGGGVGALRYLSLFHPREGETHLRAGKTGEYGYDLLVPLDRLEASVGRLREAGQAFDLVEADRAALSLCALEGWFFDGHFPGTRGRSPIELGLQWRVAYRRGHWGAEALDRRRRSKAGRRLTALRADRPFAAGDRIELDAEVIGEVVRAELSPTLGCYIGAGLIERTHAHSGIDRFVATSGEDEATPLLTVSPPFVDNLSLYVKPGRDCYAERAAVRYAGPAPGPTPGPIPGPG